MNQIATFLIKVRDTIKEPTNWGQGHYASNMKGNAVDIDSPEAVSYCLIGAMLKVDGERRSKVYLKAYHTLSSNIYYYPTSYNDTHSHSQVIALLDKTIKANTGWRRFFKFW